MKFFDSETHPEPITAPNKTTFSPKKLHEALAFWSKTDRIDAGFDKIESHLKSGTSPFLDKETIEYLTTGPLRYSPDKMIALLNLLLKYGLDINNPMHNGLFIFADNILAYKNTVLFRLLLEYGLTIHPLEQEKIEALVNTVTEHAVTSLDHYVLAILQYQHHPKWGLPIEAALEKAVDSMHEYAYLRSIQFSLAANRSTDHIETWLEKALERVELIKQHSDGSTLTPIYNLLILTLYELNQQTVHEELGDLIIRGIILLNQHLSDTVWLPIETKHKMESLNENPLPSLRVPL